MKCVKVIINSLYQKERQTIEKYMIIQQTVLKGLDLVKEVLLSKKVLAFIIEIYH